MKLQIVSALALLSAAEAGVSVPSVSVDVKGIESGSGPFEGLDPVVSWGASTSVLGCDIETGATSSIKPTLDVLSLPKSVWGKISTQAGGWGISSTISAKFDGSKGSKNLALDNDDLDANLEIASVGGALKTQVQKGFDVLGGRLSVNPRYNLANSEGDVVLGYDTDGTSVTIEASCQQQKLTVAQRINDGNRITPSVTSNGDVSVAWRKSLDGGNSVTTTLNVNDSVSVQWQDGPWTATFSSPMDGIKTGDIDVKINRKLSLL
ncbi:hypothetical protein CTEN210_08959 [Chaetoceros tenuissimus]|uniref:Uncharacterized protein n=1 Tax=Chaetoceros tenuissimus TaxID=426638 RepID=A0AAD3CV10_9STRA|nr:hypothetical protein CTEN210_08959 [Chaetoceros tenuissimus]